MKKIVWTLVVVLVVGAAYLSLWPVPIKAVSWAAPAVPGYTGVHAVNDKLAGLNLIALGVEAGPEHIVLARDGKLYAAMASGNIVRMQLYGPSMGYDVVYRAIRGWASGDNLGCPDLTKIGK